MKALEKERGQVFNCALLIIEITVTNSHALEALRTTTSSFLIVYCFLIRSIVVVVDLPATKSRICTFPPALITASAPTTSSGL